MKAIKKASGFAVSALALAIAGQAVADGHGHSDTEFEVSGSLTLESVHDLEGETRSMDYTYAIMEVGVKAGIFSATILGEAKDDESGYYQENDTLVLDDIMVEDGAISFGDIGETTPAYDLLDGGDLYDEDQATSAYDVDGAIAYTTDFGLKAQIEGAAGAGEGDWGLGLSYTGEYEGGVSVYADYQSREAAEMVMVDHDNDPLTPEIEVQDGMESLDAFVGLGIEYSADMFGLQAAYVNVGDDTEIAARLTATPMEALSAYLLVLSTDAVFDADEEWEGIDVTFAEETEVTRTQVEVGADYSVTETVSLGGHYATFDMEWELVASEATVEAEGTEIAFDVSYSEGAISAFVEYTLTEVEDAEDTTLELEVAYTSENDVTYAANYETEDGDSFEDATSVLTLSASYEF